MEAVQHLVDTLFITGLQDSMEHPIHTKRPTFGAQILYTKESMDNWSWHAETGLFLPIIDTCYLCAASADQSWGNDHNQALMLVSGRTVFTNDKKICTKTLHRCAPRSRKQLRSPQNSSSLAHHHKSVMSETPLKY